MNNTSFNVGDEVECIDDNNGDCLLVKGEIYIVSECRDNMISVLKKNAKQFGVNNDWRYAWRFKKVKNSDSPDNNSRRYFIMDRNDISYKTLDEAKAFLMKGPTQDQTEYIICEAVLETSIQVSIKPFNNN